MNRALALAITLTSLLLAGCASSPIGDGTTVTGNCVITVAPPATATPRLQINYAANGTDADSYTVEIMGIGGTFTAMGPNGEVPITGSSQLTVEEDGVFNDDVTIDGVLINTATFRDSAPPPDSVAAFYAGEHAGYHEYVVMIRLGSQTQLFVVRAQ